mmetsp:Transcript_1041/g.4138  ORF Transcript_1041/g.4138 Transcript_1041/m.4138 type:complete len:209 (-) Transcript_1041:299-925(-)
MARPSARRRIVRLRREQHVAPAQLDAARGVVLPPRRRRQGADARVARDRGVDDEQPQLRPRPVAVRRRPTAGARLRRALDVRRRVGRDVRVDDGSEERRPAVRRAVASREERFRDGRDGRRVSVRSDQPLAARRRRHASLRDESRRCGAPVDAYLRRVRRRAGGAAEQLLRDDGARAEVRPDLLLRQVLDGRHPRGRGLRVVVLECCR